MLTEWMKVMLEEIERKRGERRQGLDEEELRRREGGVDGSAEFTRGEDPPPL